MISKVTAASIILGLLFGITQAQSIEGNSKLIKYKCVKSAANVLSTHTVIKTQVRQPEVIPLAADKINDKIVSEEGINKDISDTEAQLEITKEELSKKRERLDFLKKEAEEYNRLYIASKEAEKEYIFQRDAPESVRDNDKISQAEKAFTDAKNELENSPDTKKALQSKNERKELSEEILGLNELIKVLKDTLNNLRK